jgi:hypothetical protein
MNQVVKRILSFGVGFFGGLFASRILPEDILWGFVIPLLVLLAIGVACQLVLIKQKLKDLKGKAYLTFEKGGP